MWRTTCPILCVAFLSSLALAQAPLEKRTIKGELKRSDPAHPKMQNPSNVHELKMAKDQTVVIRLNSDKFDAVLIVEDSAKTELAFNDDDDDDRAGTVNSKLVFTAPKDDTYRIIATCFDNEVGSYELIIEPAPEKAK